MLVTMPVNVNDHIHVKLSDRGRSILYQMRNDLNKNLRRPLPDLVIAIDKDGYTKFQIWDFMSIFGVYIGMGQELPFMTQVKIEVEVDDESP